MWYDFEEVVWFKKFQKKNKDKIGITNKWEIIWLHKGQGKKKTFKIFWIRFSKNFYVNYSHA